MFTRTVNVCVCVAVLLFCRFVFGSVQFSEHHSFTQSVTHSHTHFVGIRKDDISFYLCAHTFTATQTHTHTFKNSYICINIVDVHYLTANRMSVVSSLVGRFVGNTVGILTNVGHFRGYKKDFTRLSVRGLT